MPPFDGIGANEYIVDVTHGVCDFISAVDTPSVWELNIWYHTLNCGYTCRISGETDFPCIYGDRVGLGRAYVKLNKDTPLDYDAWVRGILDGRSYCSDGLTHLIDFRVNGLGVGEPGAGERPSVLAVKSGEPLKIEVSAAAMLDEKPKMSTLDRNKQIRELPLSAKPYWHVERARIGDTRKVPVELIVNGQAVERREIEADGAVRELTFDYRPKFSSWVAVRRFPRRAYEPRVRRGGRATDPREQEKRPMVPESGGRLLEAKGAADSRERKAGRGRRLRVVAAGLSEDSGRVARRLKSPVFRVAPSLNDDTAR